MHDCCDRSGSLEYTYESAVIPSMQTSMLLIAHKLSYCTGHACAHPDRLIVLRCVYARLRYARTLVFCEQCMGTHSLLPAVAIAKQSIDRRGSIVVFDRIYG